MLRSLSNGFFSPDGPQRAPSLHSDENRSKGLLRGSFKNSIELSYSQWSQTTHLSLNPSNLYLLNGHCWVTHPLLQPRPGKHLLAEYICLEENRVISSYFPKDTSLMERLSQHMVVTTWWLSQAKSPEFRKVYQYIFTARHSSNGQSFSNGWTVWSEPRFPIPWLQYQFDW